MLHLFLYLWNEKAILSFVKKGQVNLWIYECDFIYPLTAIVLGTIFIGGGF